MRTTIKAAVLVLTLGVAASAHAVRAAADDVDLELILAVDVSRSMDADEQRVQRDGYVNALRAPEILDAIRSGAYGRIALTYMEWSSSYYQQTLVPWTIIATKDDIDQFADLLAKAPIVSDSRTSISNALLYAQDYFRRAPAPADRRTIDVSGDGPNNDGPTLQRVRDRIVADGVTINGLPIIIRPSAAFGPFGSISLDDYYKACVTGGPGSFVIPIQKTNEFESAIRRKLVLEISSVPSNIVPAAILTAAEPDIDCNAAEQERQLIDPFLFNP